MNLHEIIKVNSEDSKAILYEEIAKYTKSLYTYYKQEFDTPDIVLMVVSVSNAAQYAKIVPANEFMDCIYHYFQESDISPEDLETEIETIGANSLMLADLIHPILTEHYFN